LEGNPKAEAIRATIGIKVFMLKMLFFVIIAERLIVDAKLGENVRFYTKLMSSIEGAQMI